MLDQTPFLQFVAPRLAKVRDRARAAVWTLDPTPLAVSQSPATHAHVGAAATGDLDFRPVIETPHHWGRKFQQCWWRLEVPALDGPRFLRWKDQGEATLYRREGEEWMPHFGMDPGHHYAPLPTTEAATYLVESGCVNTGIWVSGETLGLDGRGSRFDGAFLATRDDEQWHAWHDLDVLIDLCKLLYRESDPVHAGNDLFGTGGFRPPLENASPLLRMLLTRLNDAADAYDNDGPAAMLKVTAKIYEEFKSADWAMHATLTGHAHIDLVWKWPERTGEAKAVHSFATANALMDEYPELHFGYSQPASYEAVERRSPALMKAVQERIDAGNWEPTGAMYVESDTQIGCGEALVRSVTLGQKGFNALTGKDSPVLWLPDVFGYSGCIPSILSGLGVPYFFTTKMHWSGATRFPHSAFRWQGSDGSEVVSFIAWEHYNLNAVPAELDRAQRNQRQAGVFNETLYATGYGDGGGGVTAEMCERARRMKHLPTLPTAEWGRIDGFFDRLAEVKDKLPQWRGEMYLEYHRGVQTTHAHLKSAYRAAERGLQTHEAVHSALGKGALDEAGWKRVVFAQFHDYLPGSSIQEVYDEGVPELRKIADDATAKARAELEAGGEPCVFNPLATERIELIDGKVYKLPPLAGVAVSSLQAVAAAPVTMSGNVLSNGRVSASFGEDGRVSAMSFDGKAIPLSDAACGLVTFPDHPANYDAWDVDRPTLSNGTLVRTPVEASFDGDDARRTASFTRRVGEKSTATIRYALEAASPVLKVEIELDWQEKQQLLKMVFPTKFAGKMARYGAPFGSVLRPQVPNTIADSGMFENPASRWACVSDDGESAGLCVVTEDKYGVGCENGLLHVSLVRSALVTDAADDVPLRDFNAYGGDGWQQFSDLGSHTIRLAVGTFAADLPRNEQPATLADTLFTPVIFYSGKPVDAGLSGIDGGDSLIPASAVPGDGGSWTLRLHETMGQRGTATLRLKDGRAATRVDLLGETLADVTDGAIEFEPYQIVSVRVG